jgi:hypothetical protein
MLASVLVVGLLVTAGFVVVVLLIVLRLFFPDGIGPDDDFIGSFAAWPP